MVNNKTEHRGVNLGGWLMMEGYILHGRNIAESIFKKEFVKINGEKALGEFEKLFRDNFITEQDFKNIAAMGANVVRVPFNHKLVESKKSGFNERGLTYIDNVFCWAKRYGLKIILDLHATPGAQNTDWHGDCEGKALFWEKEYFRARTVELWKFLCDRYRNERALYAYDIMNEPVLDPGKRNLLVKFYRDAVRTIKKIDNRHLIYIEGSNWAQKIDFLKDLLDENVSISIHYYLPLFYSFNFTPFYSFPGKIEGELWNEKTIVKALGPYSEFAIENKIKLYVGEFGINWRDGKYGELKWLDKVLGTFERYGFDYTYWTYKAVANNVFPDGLYQYIPNNDYIRREGPLYGWENYINLWKKDKKKIAKFWKSRHYTPNKAIIGLLKEYFKKNK